MIDNTPMVAAINDLSGYGRCSLTVTIPIISAMGLQVCPLPTAVLTAHTGYKGYQMYDFTEHIADYTKKWKDLDLKFKSIYTGFLGNPKQLLAVSEFIKTFKTDDNIVLVDPVMADNGKVYPCFNDEMVKCITILSKSATIITPNLTEACLLANVDYDYVINCKGDSFLSEIESIIHKIQDTGINQVVITSVCPDDVHMMNVFADIDRIIMYVDFIKTPQRFAGTGDVFASLLCGYLSLGNNLYNSVKKSTDFILEVTNYTINQKNNLGNGISFEPFLYKLNSNN